LLCVREALLVYGRGFESARGEKVPMSVVVEELSELMATALSLKESNDFLRPHPLQPWSLRAFADEARLPYDVLWVDAARAGQEEEKLAGLAATPHDAAWPEESEPPTGITAKQLAKALENAPKAFLEQSLGISMTNWDTEVLDREPIELNSLDLWKVRDTLLKAVLDSKGEVDLPAILMRQRALGAIPFEAGGEVLLQGELETAKSIVERASEIGRPKAGGNAVLYSYTVSAENRSPLTLNTTVATVREADVEEGQATADVHVWMTVSSNVSDKLLLEAWCSMLIAVASGAPVASVSILDASRTTKLRSPSAEESERILRELVGLWWRLRHEPTPLVPIFSKALAELIRNKPDLDVRVAVNVCAENSWFSDGESTVATSDQATSSLFGSLTLGDLQHRADDLAALATAVWGPVLDAMPKKTTKTTGTSGGEG
jgi:exonuclease V gamma subunit